MWGKALHYFRNKIFERIQVAKGQEDRICWPLWCLGKYLAGQKWRKMGHELKEQGNKEN